MQKKIIGVDIDNVLSDTDNVIRKLIDQEYGIKSSRNQINNWSYSKSLPITSVQEKNIFTIFHNHYCLHAPVIKYAQESLEVLSAYYTIWLITCRPMEANLLTEQWLNINNFTYTKLVHSCDKTSFLDHLEFIVEDNGITAIEYARNNVPVILFNNPWNLEYSHPLIFRVNDWIQAKKAISEFNFVQRRQPQFISAS